MQLEQILSAAVAAGNVDEIEVDGLPSPDIPQSSPEAPTPTSARSPTFLDTYSASSSRGPGNRAGLRDRWKSSKSVDGKSVPSIDAGLTMNEVSEEIASCDPLSTVSDELSLFNLAEDSLVITSQQALAMFETYTEDASPQQTVSSKEESVPCKENTCTNQEANEELDQSATQKTQSVVKRQSLDGIDDMINDVGEGVPAACGEIEIETTSDTSGREISSESEHNSNFDAHLSENNSLDTEPHCLARPKVERSELGHEENNASSDTISQTTKTKGNCMNGNEIMDRNVSPGTCTNKPEDSNVDSSNFFPGLDQAINVPSNKSAQDCSLTDTLSQAINETVNQVIAFSDTQSVDQYVEQAVIQTFSQTADESVSFAVGQSVASENIVTGNSVTGYCLNISSVSQDINLDTELSSQPKYTALTPVNTQAANNPLLEDTFSSLVGLEPPAGATIDATLDENGQFLVQVIAPGLSMTIPNQFLNKQGTDAANVSLGDETKQKIESCSLKKFDHQLGNIATETTGTNPTERFTEEKKDNSVVKPRGAKRKRDPSPASESKLDKILKNLTSKKQMADVTKDDETIPDDGPPNKHSKFNKKGKKIKVKKFKYSSKFDNVSQISNSQFLSHVQSPQFAKYFYNSGNQGLMSPPPSFYQSKYPPSDNYCPPNVGNTSGNCPQYPRSSQYQSVDTFYSDDPNTWSIDEMLNPQNPPHGMAVGNQLQHHNSDRYGNYQVSQQLESDFPPQSRDSQDSDDSEQMPIIMSPEEYHGKIQQGAKFKGVPGTTELVQTDTDGDSLKVQLVYLVYPCNKNKQNGKRHPNGDVEQWQHERRREHNGHRSAGEPYPQHSSVYHSNHQPPNVPYPRTSNGGGPPYPPASSHHGYGYSPPGHYHPYSREDPQAPPQALPQAPPPLSARDKTISWLPGGEPLCPSPPRAAGSSSYSESKAAARKVDDYKSCPMSDWESRDVAHFLIEATHDLGIRYENTDFSQLNQVDGRKLLSMESKHFEKFTPTEGQRVYDYVRRHRNHEMLTNEGQNENYRSDGQHQSIVTPPPLNVDTNTSSMFPSDVYAEYPPLQPSPTLNGSMSYDLQSSTILPPTFHGPGNTSIPVGPISTPIPPDSIPLTHYQSPGMMPNHSSAGYPPPSGGMYAPTSDHYQYHANSVASGSHTRPNVPHLSADSYPTAVNKTFYSLHDPSAMYPSSEADERDPNGSMRHEESRHHHEAEMRPPSSMFTDISEQEESSDDDDDEEEEEEEEEDVVKPPEPPKKRGPGRPPKPESERKKKKRTGRLWEFIRNLLLNPETCPSIVKWEDAETGVFRFVQSEKVAERWGMRKNNQKMNYEKLSRAMRYYYKGKVFEPVLGRRLVYKFGSNAKGWKPNNANFGQ